MVLRETPDAQRWGAIECTDGGTVTRVLDAGKPGQRVCMFTGVHVMAPRLVERLPREGESDSIRQAYMPALLAGERIEAHLLTGYFHEHSTLPRYLEGNWNALSGKTGLRHLPGPLEGVDASAIVAAGAKLIGPVRIGPGAHIEPGATVGPLVVVGARARVAAGARLERVVVWRDARADGELADAIVTPRGTVRAS
jgi:NDP-sugar pyrophosphorylase family protein